MEFPVEEATVGGIHERMRSGGLDARDLVETYRDRIDRHDGSIGAFVTTNPEAMERARRLDEAFESDGFVGPLHGIPVVVKDNVDTAGLPTTVGSALLSGSAPDADAAVVERLRDAGAVVIGKSNLPDFALSLVTNSSVAGRTRNPYDTDRNPGGSSGGTGAAVAANLAVAGIGTDTAASVRCPAGFTNLVGIRPTVGLVSRRGIAPISSTHDTAGPMARTVEDAALLLDAIAGFDPADPATARGDRSRAGSGGRGLRDHLDPDGLRGARVGVLRELFEDTEGNGSEEIRGVTEAALADVEAAGATVLDPVEIRGFDVETSRVPVWVHEIDAELGEYLSGRTGGPDSLDQVEASGTYPEEVAWIFEEKVPSGKEDGEYFRLLAEQGELRDAVRSTLAADDLDALVHPTVTEPPARIGEEQGGNNLHLSPCTGFPAVTVPAGFTDGGLPVGIEFLGRPFDEPRLIELAHAYERLTGHRRPPEGFE